MVTILTNSNTLRGVSIRLNKSAANGVYSGNPSDEKNNTARLKLEEQVKNSKTKFAEQEELLKQISTLDKQLLQTFEEKLYVDHTLTRQLVSFQGNKTRPTYRWYKYKEAFSAALVEYLLSRYAVSSGRILTHSQVWNRSVRPALDLMLMELIVTY